MTTSGLAPALAAAVVGAAVSAVLVWGYLRAAFVARTASLTTERNLLRERVADLEASTDAERELAATLAPLASTIGRVERQVATLERDRLEQYARLDEQLAVVTAGGEALRVQTSALAGALRSPTARGTWGEVQLRRVVEHAGMLNRVDFAAQAVGTRPDGRAVRPDLVIHLPGGKNVVVDSKAPLAAFLEASEGTLDQARHKAAAAGHAKALRAHVDALAAKEYWKAFDPSPEIVICFLPGEAFLGAACQQDPSLLEHAMARRVVLATPSTLLALLRTVALTWQTDALSGSAKELFEVGRELYSRLGTLGGHTSRLGRALERAVEDYNALVGTLERRVLVTARRIEGLALTDGDIEEVEVLRTTVHPLTAVELIEDAVNVSRRRRPERIRRP
jgi:DNA recombination protein RmuC